MSIEKDHFIPVVDYEQRLRIRAQDSMRVVRVLAIASLLIFLLSLVLCFTNSGLAAMGTTMVGAVLLGWAWHEKAAMYPYEGIVEHKSLRNLHYFLQRVSILITFIVVVEACALVLLVFLSHGDPLSLLQPY